MKPVKSFKVFGENVDVLINGSMSSGLSTVLVQRTSPGGGPPPHQHTREDETFLALEGEFEILSNGEWKKMVLGEIVFAPRGFVHTFRNCGSTVGKILTFVSPAGFDEYLEKVGPLSPATDMEKIVAISKEYGITFHM